MKSPYMLRLESQMRPLVEQLDELNGMDELSDAQQKDFETISGQLTGMKSDYEKAAERATKAVSLGSMVETLTADAPAPRAQTDRANGGATAVDPYAGKTWFDVVTESKAFRHPPNDLYNIRETMPPRLLHPLLEHKAPFTPGNMDRSAGVEVIGPTDPRVPRPLLQLIRMIPTNEFNINYLPLTFTNNAASVTPGQPKPESTNAGTIQTITQTNIAHWKEVVRQWLRYIPGLRGEVEAELSEGVLAELEQVIINGSGVAPEMRGILLQVTNAATGDTLISQIFNAIGKIGASGGTADAIVMNPEDYTGLLDAEYWANRYNPLFAGQRFGQFRIVTSGALAAGTALVGDWARAVRLYVGENVRIDVTEALGLKSNIVTFRGEMDAVVLVARPWLMYTAAGPLVPPVVP